MGQKRRFPECWCVRRRAQLSRNSGLGGRVIFPYSKIAASSIPMRGCVLQVIYGVATFVAPDRSERHVVPDNAGSLPALRTLIDTLVSTH